MMALPEKKGRVYEFDNYRLDARNRELLRDERRVELSSKAFDLLLALVENNGRLLTKNEMFQRVWPGQAVEESNLTVHVSHIRKALGDSKQNPRYLFTVAGHGYRFAGDVLTLDEEDELEIETHTLSRIVVERQEKDSAIGDSGHPASATEVATVPAALASSEQSAIGNPQSAIRLVPVAVLSLFLLIVAVIAVWFFRSRIQNQNESEAGAPLPAPLITMRRFTTSGGVPYRVAISPDGKSLVYVERVNGKDSLWLGQIESNSSVRISQPFDSWFGSPVFAPDGGDIYITVQDDKHPRWTLLRMPVVGGVVTELTRDVHSPVTFSPDGQRFAFVRVNDQTNETSIVVASAAYGQPERTLATRRGPGRFSREGLSWSPDGKTIAIATVRADNNREEILGVSLADGSVVRIAKSDWRNVGNLVWLPDGSGLLILAQDDVIHRGGHLSLVTYPEGAVRRLTHDVSNYQIAFLSISTDRKAAVLRALAAPELWIAPDADVARARLIFRGSHQRNEGSHGLARTPDGRLLYTAYAGESQTIWAMSGDGGNQQQLTPGHRPNSVDNQMSVTADGRYIVFHSNRSGSSEIWRANLDGSDPRQLTMGGGNSQPALSPDGQWVVYASERDSKSTLWRISIDGGEPSQLSERHLLWPGVSPDGKLIACADPTTLPRWSLIVIPFAGGEPLKSFDVPQSVFLARQVLWMRDGKAIIYRDSIQGLWRQALNEKEPQLIKGTEELPIHQLASSLNGRDLIYTLGKSTREIVIIENFK